MNLDKGSASRMSSASTAIFVALVILDFFAWRQIFLAGPARKTQFYFLDVGQGDAELIQFPGGISVLTDAGPDKKILNEIQAVLGGAKHRIDIGIVSHPQLDHFNGFNALLDRYSFGLFIINGRNDDGNVPQWNELIAAIRKKKIPLLVLRAGDKLVFGENEIVFLSPNAQFAGSGELNDTGLVERVVAPPLTALFAADTGFAVENDLISRYELGADILKVGHHGSKYSTGDAFLSAVRPRVAVIEVGSNNHYGHPAAETLERLTSSGAKFFRTDQNGTVRIEYEEGKLKVFTER